jgi:thiol:disulfide interchange protein DsbD
LFTVVLLNVAALAASAAHTQVRLILSADGVRPGATVLAGVDLKMDPGWHTYWRNSGEAGMATKIMWHLPPGVTAGDIQWPLPEKLPPAEVTTYGYNDEVMLIVPLKFAADLKPGPLDLRADISWLECSTECIPGKTNVAVTLDIGNETKAATDAALIQSWQKKVPEVDDSAAWQKLAWWEKPAAGDTRPLIVDLRFLGNVAAAVAFDKADFFPDASDEFEIQGTVEKIALSSSEVKLRLSVKKFSGDWPKEISGVVVTSVPGRPPTGIAVTFPVSDQAPATEAVPGRTSSENPASPPVSAANTGETPVALAQPLWKMLLYAFIGGLILNIMPCVLPVIALKILGFVCEARSEPGRVRKLGLVYGLGVLVSFLALALVVIAVKAAGHHAGWGMQFGSPVFIVCLTTLVTLVALNLFGVFEVTLGGRALGAAGQLASKQGAPGAFFNGLLATALATPCTAPYLAPALGFAFAQSAPLILLVFSFAGFGLAAPYVVLSWHPSWLKFLPKPGAWMEKFKIAMGFPMLLTAVWLFNLAAGDYGSNVLWLGVFLVLIAFAAWIFGEFVQRGRGRKFVALVLALLLAVGGYAFALENQLHWRAPVGVMDATGALKASAGGIDWQPWSPAAVAQARAAGHPVLVDFTADWCLTCQVNKKIAIEVPTVRKKLKELGAVALVGDYTHFPDDITTELSRYSRAGVPLVLVYPKNSEAQAIVLPQVLTAEIVLDALGGKATAQNGIGYIFVGAGILIVLAGAIIYLRRRTGQA